MCVLQVILGFLAYESIVLCMCSGNVLNGYKMFEIHFWAYKAPTNSFQVHFLSNVSSKREKTIVPSEYFDGTTTTTLLHWSLGHSLTHDRSRKTSPALSILCQIHPCIHLMASYPKMIPLIKFSNALLAILRYHLPFRG